MKNLAFIYCNLLLLSFFLIGCESQIVDAKKELLFAAYADVELKSKAGVHADIVATLELGEAVHYYQKKSSIQEAIRIEKKDYRDYYLEVKTKNGTIGWAHAAYFQLDKPLLKIEQEKRLEELRQKAKEETTALAEVEDTTDSEKKDHTSVLVEPKLEEKVSKKKVSKRPSSSKNTLIKVEDTRKEIAIFGKRRVLKKCEEIEFKGNWDNKQKAVVSICIDEKGNVIEAKFNTKKSTMTNQQLKDQAVACAKAYKYTEKDGVTRSCGDIVISLGLY